MSSICFRDPHEEVYVGGRERAMCGWWVRSLFEMALDLDGMVSFKGKEYEKRFLKLLDCSDRRQLDIVFMSHMGLKSIGKRFWDVFNIQLNTALAIGSDPIRFCVRVHGQCECHGYVEGPNRAWLAGVIDEGLLTRALRYETQGYGKGWEDVARLLRVRDDCPVVMSYSVCDSFPPRPEDADDDWYDLPLEDRWGMAMADVRSINGLEMKPENWSTIRFGDPAEDAFTIHDHLLMEMGPDPEDGSVPNPI
jgi:hypothetical protein